MEPLAFSRCHSPMDYERLLSLLEERKAIILWNELWLDTEDQDGRLARQMRLEEIDLQFQTLIRFRGHA